MDVDDEIITGSPMNVVIEDDEEKEEQQQQSNNSIQQEDLLNEPLPVIERSEPWHAQFPPSWLPIITRDIARQRRQVILEKQNNFSKTSSFLCNHTKYFSYFTFKQSPQPPYSDAYISGMSSKRRKILLSKKSSTNAQQMLAEDLRHAVQANNKSGQSSSSQSTSSNSAPAVEEIVATISNDSTIQNAYRDEVKANMSQRLKNEKDFESDKYPKSSKYFK